MKREICASSTRERVRGGRQRGEEGDVRKTGLSRWTTKMTTCDCALCMEKNKRGEAKRSCLACANPTGRPRPTACCASWRSQGTVNIGFKRLGKDRPDISGRESASVLAAAESGNCLQVRTTRGERLTKSQPLFGYVFVEGP